MIMQYKEAVVYARMTIGATDRSSYTSHSVYYIALCKTILIGV